MENITRESYSFKIAGAEFNIIDDMPPMLYIPASQKISPKDIHSHIYYEMFFVGDDPITIVTVTENIEIRNEIAIIPPKFYHYTILNPNTLGILFDMKLSAKNETDSQFLFMSDIASGGEIVRFPITERIEWLVDYFSQTRLKDDPSSPQKRIALHTLMMLELSDIAAPKKAASVTRGKNYVGDYERIIHEILIKEYMNDISLGYVAGHLHLSEKQTTRILQKNYGMSFPRLLLDRRLTVASVHLTHTHMKISEIIEATGFKTSNYFFSSFKKKYGMTPYAYRNKYHIFTK